MNPEHQSVGSRCAPSLTPPAHKTDLRCVGEAHTIGNDKWLEVSGWQQAGTDKVCLLFPRANANAHPPLTSLPPPPSLPNSILPTKWIEAKNLWMPFEQGGLLLHKQ